MSANPEPVAATRVDAVAGRLSEQIRDLSRALELAGVPPAESTRLLELASIAAMRAVTLEELGALRPEPVRRVEPPGRLGAAA